MNRMNTNSSKSKLKAPIVVQTKLRSSVISDVAYPKHWKGYRIWEVNADHTKTSELVKLVCALSKSPTLLQTVLKNSHWLDSLIKHEIQKEEKEEK